MLQQTQVSRVLPKFEHFIQRWPTIRDLSQAKLSEVIIEWQGLGYNRRAKHLLETSKIIVHSYEGNFSSDKKKLLGLPGFGPYMVSALRVFAFGMQDTVIDVNIARVLSRIVAGLALITAKEVQEIADQNVPKDQSDEWHQALMDFGAMICTAKAPKCEACPVSRVCKANKEALSLGFATYSDWLTTQPKLKKLSKKDIGKKFEETDRYFRGRVIDFLRDGEQGMEHLWLHLSQTHGLQDRVRFGKIIESLVVDGLIKVRGNTVSFA